MNKILIASCYESHKNCFLHHLQVLKQRVSLLEGATQQVDMMRQENGMLRQQLMEVESAVSTGPLSGGSRTSPAGNYRLLGFSGVLAITVHKLA